MIDVDGGDCHNIHDVADDDDDNDLNVSRFSEV